MNESVSFIAHFPEGRTVEKQTQTFQFLLLKLFKRYHDASPLQSSANHSEWPIDQS